MTSMAGGAIDTSKSMNGNPLMPTLPTRHIE